MKSLMIHTTSSSTGGLSNDWTDLEASFGCLIASSSVLKGEPKTASEPTTSYLYSTSSFGDPHRRMLHCWRSSISYSEHLVAESKYNFGSFPSYRWEFGVKFIRWVLLCWRVAVDACASCNGGECNVRGDRICSLRLLLLLLRADVWCKQIMLEWREKRESRRPVFYFLSLNTHKDGKSPFVLHLKGEHEVCGGCEFLRGFHQLINWSISFISSPVSSPVELKHRTVYRSK